MKLILYMFLPFLFVTCLNAQLGDRFYGSGVLVQMQPLVDGNYYATGSFNNAKIWLLKLNSNKDLIWEKTFAGPSNEAGYANFLLINPDGSLLLAGTLKPTSYDSKSFLIKTDPNGNLIWIKTYSVASSIYHICRKPTGGYYLSGYADNTGATDSGQVLEIDANGNLVSSFRLDVYNQTRVKYIDIADDGNLIVIGRTNVIGAGFQGVFISKRNKNGAELNRWLYDTGFRESDPRDGFYSYPLGIIKKSNGSYTIVNPFQDRDCILFDIDQNLNLKSSNIYGDGNHNELPFGLIQHENGDLAICGAIASYTNGLNQMKAFSIRLNSAGYELWRKYYQHEIANAALFGVIELKNQDLLFYGFAKTNQAWIMQTDPLGYQSNLLITGKVYFDRNSNCLIDGSDVPMKSVIIKNQDGLDLYAASDQNGTFAFHTSQRTNLLTAYVPNDYTELCISQKQLSIDTHLNSANVDFLVKPIDDCPHLNVEITQPDLVKCKSSKYKVFVRNLGLSPSLAQQMRIRFDPLLSLLKATPGGQMTQNDINYNIPLLRPGEELEFEFTVKLSCDAFLGASHLVSADLFPETCGASWKGANVQIHSECINDFAQFIIQNVGNEDMVRTAKYRVYADQYLIEEQDFQLRINESIELKYDSKGKAMQIEVIDVNSILIPNEPVYAYLEACGRNKNGIFSNAYEYDIRKYKHNSHHSSSWNSNSNGIPDRVQEMITGMGSYHFIANTGWMEYTIRARNPTQQSINQVELQLNLTSNLDIGSFQVLGNADNVKVILLDSQNLKIVIDDVQLQPNASESDADFFLKFRTRTFQYVPTDSGQQSFISISGSAYFDKTGPYQLRISKNNLTATIPYVQKPEENYNNKISLFGGRYYDFGTNVSIAKDGSVFLLIQTSSYNDGNGYQSLVVKLDKYSIVNWYFVLPDRYNYSVYQEKLIALEDGGCMLLATGIPRDKEGYIIHRDVVITRLNHLGEIVFAKVYKPGLDQRGGHGRDLFKSRDGNFLICGASATGDNNEVDNFLLKIDPDGNMIWLRHYIVESLAFEANTIFELLNGDIVCAGADDGRDLLIVQKSDSEGNKLWVKTVTPQLLSDVYIPSAVMTKNEEIVFLQSDQWEDQNTGNYFVTPHFTCLTKNGNYLYEKRPIVGEVGYARGNHLSYDKDGNFYIVGEIITDTFTYNDNAMLAKFDSDLNLLWYKDYGSSNTEWFEEGVMSDDHVMYMIGYNQRRPPDYNLQTIYVSENLKAVEVKNSRNDHLLDVMVYPNPAGDQIQLFFFDYPIQSDIYWSLVDVSGKVVLRSKVNSQKMTIDLRHISGGLYALTFSDPMISMLKIMKR